VGQLDSALETLIRQLVSLAVSILFLSAAYVSWERSSARSGFGCRCLRAALMARCREALAMADRQQPAYRLSLVFPPAKVLRWHGWTHGRHVTAAAAPACSPCGSS